jgi:GGDEF domain-containing protein
MGWLTKHVRGVPSAGSLESGPLDRWLTRFIPRELEGATVHVGASIGVAFFPDRACHFGDRITLPSIPATAITTHGEVDQESVRRLLEKADAAMYAAKRKALRYWVHEHVADETLRGTVGLLSEPPPAA